MKRTLEHSTVGEYKRCMFMELFSPASLHKMKPDYLYIGEKFDSVYHYPYLIQKSEH